VLFLCIAILGFILRGRSPQKAYPQRFGQQATWSDLNPTQVMDAPDSCFIGHRRTQSFKNPVEPSNVEGASRFNAGLSPARDAGAGLSGPRRWTVGVSQMRIVAERRDGKAPEGYDG
ncbi:hypothetical protein C8R46DRAFT_1123051, partial [Mycena filopes]